MRRILVDNYRRKNRVKHGRDLDRLDQDAVADAIASPVDDLIALDDALEVLSRQDHTAAEIVKLKYFAGLSIPEIAEVLGKAPRTVDRHWAYARAWLRRAMSSPGGEP
jgi:RNA polymerase sigma factor (TIGR02999 family)